MPHMLMDHAVDPKQEILDRLGDISDFDVHHNNVLVAVYKRPEKTKGGIILTDKYRDEDDYQSKVGLIVKAGPNAFYDPNGSWDWGAIAVGEWVVFRPSDGWNITVSGEGGAIGKDAVLCRLIQDTSIRATVQSPDMVW